MIWYLNKNLTDVKKRKCSETKMKCEWFTCKFIQYMCISWEKQKHWWTLINIRQTDEEKYAMHPRREQQL